MQQESWRRRSKLWKLMRLEYASIVERLLWLLLALGVSSVIILGVIEGSSNPRRAQEEEENQETDESRGVFHLLLFFSFLWWKSD